MARNLSLTMLAAALPLMVLASCGGDDEGDATDAPVTGRCGDENKLGDSLNFFNWADYIDTAVLTDFEAECGVAVTMDTYTSNQEMIAKVQAGNSGYSLVIPTDYAAEQMIQSDLVQKLDKSQIPNAKNIDPNQLGQYYDPDNEYSLPYQYSTTGIAYNKTAFDEPPTSWSALFDKNEHCNKSSLLDDQYEAVGAALVYLGYDFSSEDAEGHEKARDLLIEAKKCVSAFDSANFIGNLASGEVVIAEAWGFAAGIARLDNPDVMFVVPDEGGIMWQDNFMIPKDAPDAYTAHVLINYMLEADVGAKITEFILGFTPNLEAAKLLSEDYTTLINEGGIAVTDEVRSRLEPSKHGSSELFSGTWNAVTTSG